MEQTSTTNSNQRYKKQRERISDLSYGKIPPQALELESAVLGAIMLERNAFDIVSAILRPECFYSEVNQKVFAAMLRLSKKRMPIDMLTVVQELIAMSEIDIVGGPYYITKLTTNVVSAAHIESHSRIVLEKFIAREVIKLAGELVGMGYDDSVDVFDLLNETEQKVFSLSQNFVVTDYSTIAEGLVKVVDRIQKLRKEDRHITGVPTGFNDLDKVTHGLQPTDLIILAARPSVGKTAFALNVARNAAMHPEYPTAVGFFSLEMSEEQLITRILSSESNIWLESLTTGRLDEFQMDAMYNQGVLPLSKAPIVIDDTAGLNMFQLRSKARKMISKHHVGLIIIDYLQLMSGEGNKNGNREQEISKISRELKKLAKDIKVPIIALSQLSREVEKRGKGMKTPQLSDLRESGAIEQDADLVMFLYRPPDDEVAEDASLKNTGMCKISKHRHGKLAEIAFKVFNHIQKWEEVGEMLSAPSPSFIPVSQANNNFRPVSLPYKDSIDDELPF